MDEINDIEELRRLLREGTRRREEAEELAKTSQPQTLQAILPIQLAEFSLVASSPGSTSHRDEEIWADLSISDLFSSVSAFPSQHQLDYVKSVLQPISSEIGLRDFQRDVVENAVRKLVDRAFANPLLRKSLGLHGTVTFESHRNLGATNDIAMQSLAPAKSSVTDHYDGSAISKTSWGRGLNEVGSNESTETILGFYHRNYKPVPPLHIAISPRDQDT